MTGSPLTPTDTVVSEERLREILDGCEGVTPGPWRVGKHPSGFQLCGDGMWFMTAGWTVKDARNQPDAAHIARLDPATVASMARELISRRASSSPAPVSGEWVEGEVEAIAEFLRERDEAIGNESEYATDEERHATAEAIAALRSRPTVSPPPVAGVKEEDPATELWQWIEGYMADECNHLPEYLSDAERSNIVNAIRNAFHSPPQARDLVPTHRHKKRGTEYVLIGIGRMQAEEWVHTHREKATDPIVTSVDMREVAIYRSATDPTEIWVRPREEFEDGRFEPLPRSTTGGAK